MKKAYAKAEAFKVSFNANEQVAAACSFLMSGVTGTKYETAAIGTLCEVMQGQYGSTEMSMCYIDDAGSSPYMTGQYSLTD